MSTVSEMKKTENLKWVVPKERIHIKLSSELCSPEVIVKNLASIEGPVDVYSWYEGTQGLPRSGALFMKKSIFKPLFALKKDAKLYLYSLRAWDFKKDITNMSASTPIGQAINRINKAAVECLYSSAFFRYCAQVSKKSNLYLFINALSKKEGPPLTKQNGMKVEALFAHQSSLFDWIKDLDVFSAHSSMQYIEGYYLIQESVKKGLLKGQKKIEIAFVLPNDEGKYYQDFPKDIERMLQLDFGKALEGIEINIDFQLFKYGESLKSRPYVDKGRNAKKVEAEKINSYFDYLLPAERSESPPRMPFLRDVIHNINGWEA
ncbi:MAG: hypothetical protein V4487_07170 [Chlamydiota bacterium]